MQDLGLLAAFMTEFWTLIKSSYEDPQWEELFNQVENLHSKYPHPLVRSMLIAYMRYLDTQGRPE